MTDFDKRLARLSRMLHATPPTGAPKPWYRIENKTSSGGKTSAEILIYDEIDPWFGVSAGDFANELNALDVDEITVGINSPGGIVFDGIAIMNALKRHPAKIITRIDGLAASAASFIAMAGDEIQTSKYGEAMIHEAWGAVRGNADDMAAMQQLLERHNDTIANIYADRAGGDVKAWRKLMAAETWFTAQEMVDAGLADTILESEDADSSQAEQAAALKNRFDLTVFNYAGRSHAPAPTARAQAPAGDRPQKGTQMATVKEHLAAKYGLDASLDDEAFNAAYDAIDTDGDEADGDGTASGAAPSAAETAARAKELGFALVDSDTLAALQDQARQGSEAFTRMQADTDRALVEDAIRAGKIAPAARDKWLKNLAGPARDTYVEALGGLEPVFPVTEQGHGHNPDPGADMKAPGDLAWFDSAPTTGPEGN